MINQYKAVQSALLHLKAYADANSYDIATRGETVVDSTYFVQNFIGNDNDQGLSNSSSQIQLPIYQIDIHTPKAKSEFVGLAVYDELVSHFERGTDISNDAAQQVRIESVDYAELPASDTHNIIAVSVNLRLIG